MINLYESLNDETGSRIVGRTKLFVRKTDESGNIRECINGTSFAPDYSGIMFIIDDWLIPQLDKLQFKDGVLSVKDGEELIPPVKTERELQREALLKQLAELDSQLSE